jgi:hypothetical protein
MARALFVAALAVILMVAPALAARDLKGQRPDYGGLLNTVTDTVAGLPVAGPVAGSLVTGVLDTTGNLVTGVRGVTTGLTTTVSGLPIVGPLLGGVLGGAPLGNILVNSPQTPPSTGLLG